MRVRKGGKFKLEFAAFFFTNCIRCIGKQSNTQIFASSKFLPRSGVLRVQHTVHATNRIGIGLYCVGNIDQALMVMYEKAE